MTSDKEYANTMAMFSAFYNNKYLDTVVGRKDKIYDREKYKDDIIRMLFIDSTKFTKEITFKSILISIAMVKELDIITSGMTGFNNLIDSKFKKRKYLLTEKLKTFFIEESKTNDNEKLKLMKIKDIHQYISKFVEVIFSDIKYSDGYEKVLYELRE